MSDQNKALVLGGGGVTGIAWLTGILYGLEEGGVDLDHLDRIIGTSAGSAVGAQMESGLKRSDLYQRQADPAVGDTEAKPKISLPRLIWRMAPALLVRKDRLRFRQKIGRAAMRTDRGDVERRRQAIAARLPVDQWQRGLLEVIAIDAESGQERWFGSRSGVTLREAVGASCAVPGVWPTVEIEGRHYYDGGIPSPDNAERAAGFDRVLVISPLGDHRKDEVAPRLERELSVLREGGARVHRIVPDTQSREAMGRRPLDPARRSPSAKAGYRQGREEAAHLITVWNGTPIESENG